MLVFGVLILFREILELGRFMKDSVKLCPVKNSRRIQLTLLP